MTWRRLLHNSEGSNVPVFVYRDGQIVPKSSAPPKRGVFVISDVMDPAKHMGTGVLTDSKSHFRAMTKAIGAIEVGTDPAASRPLPKHEPSMTDIVNDVRRSISENRR